MLRTGEEENEDGEYNYDHHFLDHNCLDHLCLDHLCLDHLCLDHNRLDHLCLDQTACPTSGFAGDRGEQGCGAGRG